MNKFLNFLSILGLIVKLSSEMKSTPVVDTQNFFNNSNGANFCSVNLPSPQEHASPQAKCAQRCFIVCSPHVLPIHVLKKVFCRFGNLIDVYLLSNRNCGYVKYASHESARQVNNILFSVCFLHFLSNCFIVSCYKLFMLASKLFKNHFMSF